MSTLVTLESVTAERVAVPVESPNDPTGSNPEFAVTQPNETDPLSWIAGVWADAWDATTGRVEALSPVTGDGQALDVGQGDYDLWIKWTAGGETPVKHAARLRVT